MYSICTLLKRTNTVHILYKYCTYAYAGRGGMMCDPRWSGGGGRVTAGDEKQVAELLKSVDGI